MILPFLTPFRRVQCRPGRPPFPTPGRARRSAPGAPSDIRTLLPAAPCACRSQPGRRRPVRPARARTTDRPAAVADIRRSFPPGRCHGLRRRQRLTHAARSAGARRARARIALSRRPPCERRKSGSRRSERARRPGMPSAPGRGRREARAAASSSASAALRFGKGPKSWSEKVEKVEKSESEKRFWVESGKIDA